MAIYSSGSRHHWNFALRPAITDKHTIRRLYAEEPRTYRHFHPSWRPAEHGIYDPFDLTRLEVWFQNTFLQLAEPDRVVSTIHPDVEPDPRPLLPSNTGLDYLALLRAERERLLHQQLQGLRFSQLTQEDTHDQPE